MSHPKLKRLLATFHFACLAIAPAAEKETIRVMSFNMWHGGAAGEQPFERTVAVVKESGADIAGLQEASGDSARKLAEALGWHCFDQGGSRAIISRFEITGATPKKWGVRLKLPSGRHIHVFNAHLAHAPYQPYQLLGIPYHNSPFLTTADEAVLSAEKARGGQVSRMLAEIQAVLPEGGPVFITGDFNEPSHLDWTPAAVQAGHCPLEVRWPSTKAVEAAGFTDAYRSAYPDPVKHRGLTWTNTTSPDNPKDKHDRIDFVFVKGATVKTAKVVGESRENADVVVSPYPSDHRAALAEIEY